MRRKVPENHPIGIAFLGAGVVGSSVLEHYSKLKSQLEKPFGPFVTTSIVVKSLNKKRPNFIPLSTLSTDAIAAVTDPGVNIVVSLLGEEAAEFNAISSALNAGKYVVTANKVVIAKYAPELYKLADEKKVGLFYEASVGGAIQEIDNLIERFHPANIIYNVRGIINGTTNYILTQMAVEKLSYRRSLKEAQYLGYAEPDPTADVEGYDAVYKLAILASLAFRKGWLDFTSIHREGISRLSPKDFAYAKSLGYKIKLIASAKNTDQGIEAWVAPAMVPSTHPLARYDGPKNAITLEGFPIGQTTAEGAGAGGSPTSASVWSDIEKAAKYLRQGIIPTPLNLSNRISALPINNCRIANYVRLSVLDKPGVIGKIGTIIGDELVSINQILQVNKEDRWLKNGEPYTQIVIDLDPSEEGRVSKALNKVKNSPVCSGINSRLKILV